MSASSSYNLISLLILPWARYPVWDTHLVHGIVPFSPLQRISYISVICNVFVVTIKTAESFVYNNNNNNQIVFKYISVATCRLVCAIINNIICDIVLVYFLGIYPRSLHAWNIMRSMWQYTPCWKPNYLITNWGQIVRMFFPSHP